MNSFKLSIIALLLFSGSLFAQINRGRTPVNNEQNEGQQNQNPNVGKVKGEKAVNCNTDLEMEGNGLVYHAKTGKPYTGLCISYYDNRQLERKVRFVMGKEQDT